METEQLHKISSKTPVRGNCIINRYENYSEIVFYDTPFSYFEGKELYLDPGTGEVTAPLVERIRKFVLEGDCLRPNRDDAKLADLLSCIKKGARRAHDFFFGYANANHWDYFITLTVNPRKYGCDDKQRKAFWAELVKAFQRINADVKVLAVPERHKSTQYGGLNKDTLHFHALVGNCDLMPYLTPARDPHTFRLLFTKFGHQIYNSKLWKYGWATFVPIVQTDDSQRTVVNYMVKYVNKDMDAGYGQKRYYHTRNLNFKDKRVTYLNDMQRDELCMSAFRSQSRVRLVKRKGVTVYHVYDHDVADALTTWPGVDAPSDLPSYDELRSRGPRGDVSILGLSPEDFDATYQQVSLEDFF